MSFRNRVDVPRVGTGISAVNSRFADAGALGLPSLRSVQPRPPSRWCSLEFLSGGEANDPAREALDGTTETVRTNYRKAAKESRKTTTSPCPFA